MRYTLLIAICILFLSWCNRKAPSKGFEEKHFEDMQNKAAIEATNSGENISTIALLAPAEPQEITEMNVWYATSTTWFYAEPVNIPDAPWIILIHERRWLNDHIKDMVRIFAMNWYKALAVDLYNWQVASDMETAMKLSQWLNQEEATQNLLDAETYLRTKTTKVASLWRCLGGKQSLELSLASDTLDATIIYYGRLTWNVEILKNINEPVLWIFAENDNWIPPSAVQDFEAWLAEAGKTNTDITIYSWVNHAFANPTWKAFAKEATLDAWSKTLDFLNTNLR